MQEVVGSIPIFSTTHFKSDFSMFTVYIIYSNRINRYYVGYSADIQKRLAEHNTSISDFTAKTNDWQLKYTEIFSIRQPVINIKSEINNKKSRKYIEWLIANSI